MATLDETVFRTFDTGATRDTDADKLDFESFLSPLVLRRFAQYMHENRRMGDGNLRSSDNWQQGIPRDQYMKSLERHLMDMWAIHRGFPLASDEPDIEQALCGVLFNSMGYLFEVLKQNYEDASDRLPINPGIKADISDFARSVSGREGQR